MRKFHLLAGIAALMTLTSCPEVDQPKDSYALDYYFGGNIIDEDGCPTAVVYMNSKELLRLDDGVYITGMVNKNGTIYSSGYYKDENLQPHAVFYKDDRMENSSINFPSDVLQSGLFDNSVYGVGNAYREDGSHGILIRDGEVIFEMEEANTKFSAFIVGTDGAFYIAGNKGKQGYLFVLDRVSSKDPFKLTFFRRITPETDTDNYYEASDIRSSHPIISWNRYSPDGERCVAGYSVGYTYMDLTTAQSYINSTTAYHGYYYAGGYTYRADGTRVGTIWCNGQENHYGDTVKEDNYIFKCIFDSVLMHYVLVSDGKINVQIVDSYYTASTDFTVASGFQPTCMYVTYTKTSANDGSLGFSK